MDAGLSPELERFAIEAVASGRYHDRTAVIAAGLELLRRQEVARAGLLASVLAAEAEADREGTVGGDEVLARVEARLARRAAPAA